MGVVAGSGGIASILRGDDVAVGAASFSVDVPLALRVGVAISLGAVLVLALGAALVVGSDFAGSLSEAARDGASFAGGDAGTSGGGEHALSVLVTLILDGVADNAIGLASHLTGTDGSFSPDAVSVGTAGSLSGAGGASSLAGVGGGLPHAHAVVGFAGSLSTGGRAGSLAGLAVPHAEGVGEALHLSGVDVHALAAACVVGAPGAEAVGLAVTLAVDTGTVLSAHTSVLVPDAASVSRAVFGVGVEGRAGFEALGGDAIPTAALVVVAGGFELVDLA